MHGTRVMNWSKTKRKVIKNVARAVADISLPAIPYLARKKKTSVLPFVLGAIGVAIAGGITAVMIMSPRTRYRALDAAKGGYGKVKGKLDAFHIPEKLGFGNGAAERTTMPETPYSNGLSSTGL